MKALLIFFSLFLLIANCFAQNPVYKQYTVDDGLPGMEVYQTIQDHKGFIWIATSKGVARFDGSRFENFTVENGLPDNEVMRLVEDVQGRIWFISFTGALSYYDGFLHSSSNTSFLKKPEFNKRVITFTALSTGEILFSTQNGFTFSLHDTLLQVYDSSSNNSIFERKDHSVLMIDIKRVNATEWMNGKQTSKVKFDYETDFDKSVYNKAADIFLTAKSSGLYYYQNHQQFSVANSNFYKDQHSRFFTSDKDGFFWLPANEGCFRFYIDENHELVHPEKYLEGFVIDDVFEDADHNFWFATRGDGLLMVPSLHVKVFNKSSGLADNNVTTAIKTSDGTIICGTLNGYVHVINTENKIAESLDLQSLRVRKIITDNGGSVWIACERNLFKKEVTMIRKSPNAGASYKTISAAADGSVLVGGYARVFKIDNQHADTLLKLKTILRFYAVSEWQNGKFLLGTEKGVYVLEGDSLQPFHHERKPFAGSIDEMAKTNDGKILITTRDSGLAIVSVDAIAFLNTTNGLQSNTCTSVFYDAGTEKIYVATSKGLSIITNLSNDKKQIVNYNASNGLQCGSIYSVSESRGEILISSEKGLVTFSENDFHPVPEVSKIFLSKIEINSKDVPMNADYSLPYNENNIRIIYSGVAYRDPKSLMYRYKLFPSDSGWNITFSNTIIYPDLRPGRYQFSVQVRSGSGAWSNAAASVHFEIAKPLWRTWWFITTIIILLFGSVFLIVRYRIIQSRRKHEIENELLHTELRALRSQINPHFIFNSLNSIQDFIFNNEKEAANEYLIKFANLMRMILDNSSKKYISLAEEISFLKIYLQLEGLRFANKFSYSINIPDDVDSDHCFLPPMILQLYLENAILHGLGPGSGDGKLSLSFSLHNDGLNCIIEDNGIGRKRSAELQSNNLKAKHHSHGMSNTNERIEAINKTGVKKIFYSITDLEDENGNAMGTRVEIHFPQELFA